VTAVVTVGVAALCHASSGSAAPIPAVPIEAIGPEPTVPAYVGKPAKPDPVAVEPVWQNPYMAPNPRNSVHNDSWQSDAYSQLGGPLGRSPRTFSTAIGRTCITLTFDAKGRLIGTCTNLDDGPGLYLLDPHDLSTLAFHQLPYVPPPEGTSPALNTTGGVYFYLDEQDRVTVAASNGHILVFRVDDSGTDPTFEQVGDHDLNGCIPSGERIPSALPDLNGRIWFVGRYEGTIGILDPRTGRCTSTTVGEEIENSFAVDRRGIYVVSDSALYKLKAGPNLQANLAWRARYRNSGVWKPGQVNAGSGTTPTLIGTGKPRPDYVAITDNADPMNVVVYRTADDVAPGERRVCRVPVFAAGASATENSLISMGRSLIVENNYGYDLLKFNDIIAGGIPLGGDPALVSSPGMARIDIDRDGEGCHLVWTNRKVRAPSVVPKGNARNGLIYTFENTRDRGAPKSDPWYWTALDYDTGKVAWKRLAGHGGLYNNHYAGIALGRDRQSGKPTLYLGGVGGIMALRDRR